MNKVKISIIIPTYNSAEYMKKCIESCINQTIKDIEIIVVDDCSNDNSPEIIKKYEDNYPNLVKGIYLKKNLRQGGARNVGLRAAKGEYIAFVDSDDWIDINMCEIMYKKSDNADIVAANHYKTNGDVDQKVILNFNNKSINIDKNKRMHYVKNCGYFWCHIYRRKFLLENNIFFPENVFFEDAWFNFMTAIYAKTIIKVNNCFYHYCVRDGSTIHTRNNERLYDRITIANIIMSDCHKRNIYESFKNIIDYKFISMMSTNILWTVLEGFDYPDVDKLRLIQTSIKKYCKYYKKTEIYREMNNALRMYLTLTVKSPKLTIICYKLNIHKIISMMIRRHS